MSGTGDEEPGGLGRLGRAAVDSPTAVDPLLTLILPVDHGHGAVLGSSAKQVRRQQLGLLLRSRTFLVGAAILLLWIVCAIFGGMFRPYDPLAVNLFTTNAPPSGVHLFGTDSLGRDVLSRAIIGSREILFVAPSSAALGTIFGTVMGLVQGYYRGLVDMITGRIIEAYLALPLVIAAFVFIVALGPSILTLVLVISITFGFLISRTVRTAVLLERDLDYVAAARLQGEGAMHNMFVEILPNVMGPIIVEFTVRLGYAIFLVATLSFLGFGVSPPTPDWGADIAANYQYLVAGYWWETLFPALAIASLITAINLMGDSIETVVIQ
jgi:peptide/nickel transport system permease protein